jgi:hypothetical protein
MAGVRQRPGELDRPEAANLAIRRIVAADEDDGSPEPLGCNAMKIQKVIIPLVLILQSIYSWRCFYEAQFLKYDDNVGLLIHAFIISLFTLFTLLLIWFIRRRWIKLSFAAVIIWLFVGSPFTFSVVALYYQHIFTNSLPGSLSP